MTSELFLGIDIGSVSVNTTLLNEKKEIIEDHYDRTHGQPVETVARVLLELFERIPHKDIRAVGITGSGGKLVAELIGARFVNEIVAQAKAVEFLHPEVKTVIEIGGEDSKLILLEYDSSIDGLIIADFSMNTICAAGTGSFLDQQAARLGVSIEDEFGALALRSKNPPRIAGRCSVFAKTDMIHLQQEGTPDYDIVAGLCAALARNYKANIIKGKKLHHPIAFQGGVAANKGMVRAFEDVLGLKRGELIIPKYHASMGAIGASLIMMESKSRWSGNLSGLEDFLQRRKKEEEGALKPLSLRSSVIEGGEFRSYKEEGKVRAYMGIDVGSISTNVVVIDEQKQVLAKRYLMTAGRPIEAVRKGIEEIGKEIGERIEIVGVGTTGSGRYLIGDFVGADVIKNEITSQARAAVEQCQGVDTIFEIGGQDSKYISLDDGAIVDFEMNKVCAAGTGSFLEEQAEKLNIKIEEEFGAMALSSTTPVPLGERCTVFMESDLLHHQQKGSKKDDLVAGLSYSIVHNYLNRVVGDKRIGNRIFFQGGVAANKGVVAAFEVITGKPITVPLHHEVTGAIGVAIIAMEERNGAKTNFKGFDLTKRHYSTSTFECNGCENLCEIRQVKIEGEKPLFYGSRCEKYERRREKGKAKDIPDLFMERERFLLASYKRKKGAARIGIPYTLFFHELLPMWLTFFEEAGFEVVLSDRTNRKIIHMGIESVVAETCFPIKVAHGHILNLLDKKVDYIFLPSIINMERDNPKIDGSFNCPYVQALPYIIKSSLDIEVEVIQPILRLQLGRSHTERVMKEVGRRLKVKQKIIKRAAEAAFEAQKRFYSCLRERGEEVLGSIKEEDKAMVIVSRPYNGCDAGLNLDLPKKLQALGVLAIPMDFLKLDSVDLSDEWPNMYWRYGQRILSAAELIRSNDALSAIYLTNFGCGPDSFITKFFQEKMKGKPYLQIELDEHNADVGVITRCEAFLDSLENAKKKRWKAKFISSKRGGTHWGDIKEKTIYIPYMGDHSFTLRAAFQAYGISAEVFPESNEETVELGRKYTSGKECYPCIVTTGDMIRLLKSGRVEPRKIAFFMPSGSGPCRFGQYSRLQQMILKELGYEDVVIIAPNQGMSLYRDLRELGGEFVRKAWQGIVAADILDKLRRELRPYELNKGEVDGVYEESLHEVCEAIVRGESLVEVLKGIKEKFKKVKVDGTNRRPIVGIVGEIFVRSNWFSNNNIVREIESLGGEVWLPPIGEWILYTNYTRMLKSLIIKDYRTYLSTALKDWIQKHDEHRLSKVFKSCISNFEEPTIKETLNYSTPYLHPSFEGEAVLSVGKAIDFAKKGLSGIVNVMPFTCMPGTIVSAILKRVREDFNNIPCLNIAYDGLEEGNTRTRLEAFMYQVNQYKAKYKSLKET